MQHPWDDVIPQSDQKGFEKFWGAERPLESGPRPALVIVDMNKACVDGRFLHGWTGGEAAIEPNRRLLDAARVAGIPIYFTLKYPLDYDPAPSQGGRWKHAKTDYLESRILVDELRPQHGEVVIHKHSKPSGFFGTPLASYLTYERIDTVIVTGMTTSGCVRATVVDAFSQNYYVIVPEECVADRSVVSHKVNLFDMHMKYADVVPLSTVLDYLGSIRRAPEPAMAR